MKGKNAKIYLRGKEMEGFKILSWEFRVMNEKTKSAIALLEGMISDLKNCSLEVVDINMRRHAIEKPVRETSGIYKEYEPTKEYHVEFTLVRIK